MQKKITHLIALCAAIVAVMIGLQYSVAGSHAQSLDSSVLATLTTELRLLRQALERSATQKSQAEIELQALRLQQESADRFRQQLYSVQDQIADQAREYREAEATVLFYEKKLAEIKDQSQKDEFTQVIQTGRRRMEDAKLREQQLREREATLKAEQDAEKERAEAIKIKWRDLIPPKQ